MRNSEQDSGAGLGPEAGRGPAHDGPVASGPDAGSATDPYGVGTGPDDGSARGRQDAVLQPEGRDGHGDDTVLPHGRRDADGTNRPGTLPDGRQAHDGTVPSGRQAHDGTVPGGRQTHDGSVSGSRQGYDDRGDVSGSSRPGHDDRGDVPGGRHAHGGDGVPGTDRHGRDAGHGRSGSAAGGLLPRDESDKLALRLQQAVTGFVDGPRAAVEEADRVLEDVIERLMTSLAERRRGLHRSWQSTSGKEGGHERSTDDTEQLRLALRDYRETAERLLRI